MAQQFYPVVTATLFVSTTLLPLFLSTKNTSALTTVSTTKYNVLLRLSLCVFSLFIVESILVLIQMNLDDVHTPSQNDSVFALGSCLVWLCLSILLYETSPYWPAYFLSWFSTATFDSISISIQATHRSQLGVWDSSHVVLRLVRVLLLVFMVMYGILSRDNSPKSADVKSDEETSSLLGASDNPLANENCNAAEYGAIKPDLDNDSDDDSDEEDEDDKEIKELQKKRVQEQGGWLSYIRGFAIFLPYILPYKDRYTQFWFLVIVVCVVIQRFLTVMIPRQLGEITDALTNMHGTGIVPWKDIIIWGLLQYPGAGITEMIKEMGHTRVSQFAYSELKSAAFAHVMSLSMDYHSVKSSGKLTKAIEQGTDLNSIINNFFTAGPMLIDLAVAAVYLTSEFDVYMGLIVLTSAVLHIYATLKTNSVTVPAERIASDRVRVENEVLYDSVTNWQTVAYHNRQKFEQQRYANAVRGRVMTQRRYYDWIDYGEAGQTFILDAGLLMAASLAASRVAAGTTTVSSFVFLIVYWSSIREPMKMITWTFHETSAHLVNAEWLFQLLQNKPSIQDKPNATDLVVRSYHDDDDSDDADAQKGSKVEFRNVSFAYDPQRPILSDLNFTALPGQSVALVGETGGGKSTILKLLWRFYDATSGSVAIDDQDLRDVTLDSLRECLGAVPQEPSVFDQTIMENVRYAHPDATREDVISACKAAQIHDQIMSFPNGYNTRLGERGVRLSGGELQRLAIARVILRRPQIVILDEATSAVDSSTEASVQKALRTLAAGRTVFTVAHRLSTVVSADLILVLDKGRIVERGTHQELLEKGGKYLTLWSMQTTAQSSGEAAEETTTDLL